MANVEQYLINKLSRVRISIVQSFKLFATVIGDVGILDFRLRGDRRFDRVGAVGGCAAISATQDVMGRSSADVRFGSKADMTRCPLYPRKRTLVAGVGMSALCHKRTFTPSFDDLVSATQ